MSIQFVILSENSMQCGYKIFLLKTCKKAFLNKIFSLIIHAILTKFQANVTNNIYEYVINLKMVCCTTLYDAGRSKIFLIQCAVRSLIALVTNFSGKNARANMFFTFPKSKNNSSNIMENIRQNG